MDKRYFLIGCFTLCLSACDNLPDYTPVDQVYWPEQNWNEDQRQKFYHTAQGTQLLPLKWFLALEQPSISLFSAPLFRNDDYIARFGFLPDTNKKYNPEALPVGFAVDRNFDNPNTGRHQTVVGITCAGCHTGQIEYEKEGVLYGIRIEGGSASANLDKFSVTLGVALTITYFDPFRFRRFARKVLGEDYTSEEKQDLKQQMRQYMFDPSSLAAAGLLTGFEDANTKAGFGRLSALERIGNVVFVNLSKKNLVAANAPANFPFLWYVSWLDWIQYNGSIHQPMTRNVGEALGVNSPINLTDPSPQKQLFQSTVQLGNLYELEGLLGGPYSFEDPNLPYQGLEYPAWPEPLLGRIDQQKAIKGARLYKQYCQHCHLPPIRSGEIHDSKYWSPANQYGKRFLKVTMVNIEVIGTDEHEAIGFARRVVRNNVVDLGALYVTDGKGTLMAGRALRVMIDKIINTWYDKNGVAEGDRPRMNGFRENRIRAPLAYKARPLDGVWATAPYLHNGSVPNLYQMLVPANERDKEFYTGNKRFDPRAVGFLSEEFSGGFEYDTSKTGNSNRGHEFSDSNSRGVIGPLLSDNQRWELIEYLKTM